jgi:membrane protease subunit HflK
MAWNEPGGGKKDPWNSGGGDQGPDVEAFLNRLKASLNRVFGGGGGGNGARGGRGSGGGLPFGLLLLGLFALWIVFDSWTVIQEQERGVVLRFGKAHRVMGPGPNFKWPRPIESVIPVETTRVRNLSDKEVRMLTKDENIVLVDFNVQYQVSDPKQFLFGTRDPAETLQQAAESAVREVMGNSEMDKILLERSELAQVARDRLQASLKQYQTGITVSEFNLQNARPPLQVKDAFDDAITAREDKQRIENEAQAYASKQLPEARGDAARVKAESEGYKAAIVARAQGDADRFALLVSEYRKAPEITRRRLYLETMQTVLAENRKVVVSDRDGNNVLYLPLDKGSAPAAPTRAASDFAERLPAVQSTLPGREAYRDPREAPRTGREGGRQ